MKKNLFLRCLLGAPIGLTISIFITLIVSIAIGDGSYHAVHPELVSDFGTELNAVLIKASVSMFFGAVFAGVSVIWDMPWSLLRMTITHFAVCSVVTLPIAYYMRWTERSLVGILMYFGTFVAIYTVIWIISFCAMKRKLKAINEKVGEI